ncbi:FtsH protease activity modulator HflK [Rhodobacteraceae bacterium NNCM2]|nr:FtsH protease activity modulator HflK [Coraliihabitans acroporae]
MPFNSNNGGGGGPWGGGKKGGGRNPWGGNGSGGGGGGGGDQGGPDLDDLLRRGREQLRVVLGGKDGGGPNRGGRGGGSGQGPNPRFLILAGLGILVAFWLFQSFYRVNTGEQSVELTFGKYSQTGTEGLNFAPWPIVTYEIVPVARENSIDIGKGSGGRGGEKGLMLTGDENIVDIDFSVVWNISSPNNFLFNLAEPNKTITAVSESAMREVIARSNLATILTVDRAAIEQNVRELIQTTLDSYDSGVNIVRLNFERADPPAEVIDAFRDVQAAEQDRITEQNRADAYANQKLAAARGQVAQLKQEAEGYRAQVVNEAKGEAARFVAVFDEYKNAPDVTRRRLYIETMERVLGDLDKVLIDENSAGSQGVVPYLPLNQLQKGDKQ